jgi:hypothetical protein
MSIVNDMSPYANRWLDWHDLSVKDFKQLPNYQRPQKWKKSMRTDFGDDCCLVSDTAHMMLPPQPHIFSYTLESDHFGPLNHVHVKLTLDTKRLVRQIAAVHRVDFENLSLEENLMELHKCRPLVSPTISAVGIISPYPDRKRVLEINSPNDEAYHVFGLLAKKLTCCWDWSDHRLIIYDPDVPSSRVILDKFPHTGDWINWGTKRAEDAANIAAVEAALGNRANAVAAPESRFDFLLSAPPDRAQQSS